MSKETKKKVAGAFDAMKNLGIPVDKVKPVLKNLLKLYDKNWELIEAENYRALADAIFESEEAETLRHAVKLANNEAAEHSKKNMNEKEDYLEEDAIEEPERPLKRLRLRYQEGLNSSINNSSVPGAPLILPKEEPDVLPENQHVNLNQSQSMVESSQSTAGNTIVKSQAGMFQALGKNKGKQPVSPNSSMVHESCDPCWPNDFQGRCKNSPLRIEFKSPSHPMQLPDKAKGSLSPIPEKGSVSDNSMVTMHLKEPNIEPDTFQSLKRKNIENHGLITYHPSESNSTNGPFPLDERAENGNHAMISDVCPSNLEIASSPCGEVKILLNCDLALRNPDFHMPGLEAVLKSVEDNFLKSYKTVDPKISVRNLMQEMCERVMRLGTKSTNELAEATGVPQASDLLKNSFGMVDSQFGAEIIPKMLLLPSYDGLGEGLQPNKMGSDEDHVTNGKLEDNDIEGDSSLTVGKECLLTCEGIMSLYDAIDISKAQEKVAITLVNGFNNEPAPSFCYITQNAVFQNAHVSFSLARIKENKCCSTCFGDCLSSSTPCACGLEIGGQFAYTLDGLVKEEFLNECISMSRDPKKHCQFFCKLCPLQKSINQDVPEPCKGHLMRKFIKECWWKCGCNKQCGNRVVQRGITFRIQVFMTAEGKGWGLRTLEDIPKGAFVCEYVGEVLTNSELFDRVSQSPQGMKHSYPVLLDADWGSKGVLKDEEALYLDATCYGNVARFINHRCYDSNLVSIPVEVETPDHHYYHLALFTTRNVKAMDELTCDYRMDFGDNDHSMEAFQCLCGSKFCHKFRLQVTPQGI